METSEDPRIGTVINDRYRIVACIAAGGMGVVYRGERVQLGRPVAIKFLHASLSQDENMLGRFEREARAMSLLGHPHCVSVIDFGIVDAPYIVMDYVTGQNLRDVLEETRLPVPRAIQIGRQVLAGLAHAHGQGIIHRDVKPANIMLTEATGTGDHVRILDFGLAKLFDGSGRNDLSMTQIAIGTPSSMSPEQARGERVDARSDVYSTGVLLYELLTGTKPFIADDTFELLRMQREEPPPRLGDAPTGETYSNELEAVVARALAKDPDERFENALEFARALDAVPEALQRTPTAELRASSSPPRAATRRASNDVGATAPVEGRRRHTSPLFAALFIAALCVGAWLIKHHLGRSPVPVAGADRAARDASPAHAALAARDGTAAPRTQPDGATPAALNAIPPSSVSAPSQSPPQAAATTQAAGAHHVAAPVRKASHAARQVKTIAEAKRLIVHGKRDAALAGLLKLRRKYPHSAEVPYLLGNLYFDKMWWSDALADYRAALKNSRRYRRNRILNHNVIRTLGSRKTYRRAWWLLRHVIGRPALRYLRAAAKHDKNPVVRRRAAELIRAIR